ncbi:MAG: acetyl-CoA carboxylase carboxyltransferase subunit alpha [Planctomycetota bacterium]
MNGNGLEFEAPLRELGKKITELENFQTNKGYDLQEPIARLREQLHRTAKEIFGNLTPWQQVQVARHLERPTALDYVELMCTDFVELHGDRAFRDDRAMVCGFARLDGRPVMMVGLQRGRTTKERLACNWGMAHPEGYRKSLLKMKLAERFRTPIVALIDTAGAYPGIEAEERGQPHAISANLVEMLKIRVPIVSVVIGEGGSGGALAIAVANRLCMLEHSTFSVIAPEGCSAILFHTAEKRVQAAEALKLTAQDLAGLGIIDEIIPEPLPAAHWDRKGAAANLKTSLVRHLDELAQRTPEELVAERRRKYRNIGTFTERST